MRQFISQIFCNSLSGSDHFGNYFTLDPIPDLIADMQTNRKQI